MTLASNPNSITTPKIVTTKIISIDNNNQQSGDIISKKPEDKQKFYIKKVITEGPNKVIQRTEIITDPDEVNKILQKKKRKSRGMKSLRILK